MITGYGLGRTFSVYERLILGATSAAQPSRVRRTCLHTNVPQRRLFSRGVVIHNEEYLSYYPSFG